MNDFFIFTQARLNSQRLPKKMIRSFSKSSLWEIACKKLELLPYPKELKWVSVFEPELKDIAKKFNISIHDRSEKSANCDNEPSVIWEICSDLDFSRYVLINPCLPMLRTTTINNFIERFKNTTNSLFAVRRLKDYLWNNEGNLIHPAGTKMLNTKEFDENPSKQLFIAAHCLYGGYVHNMMSGVQLGSFSKGDPELFTIDNKLELFDVDDYEDFLIAEAIYERYSEQL